MTKLLDGVEQNVVWRLDTAGNSISNQIGGFA